MSKQFLVKQKLFKFVVVVCMCVFVLCVYSYKLSDVYDQLKEPFSNEFINSEEEDANHHKYIVEQYYNKRESLKTSNLGSILFKNQHPKTEINKNFVLLIWKQWDWLKNRHLYNFGAAEHDPLDGCSVKNCKFTGDDKWLASADAVVVHLQRGLIPDTSNRNPRQRWIFLNDESPLHSFSLAPTPPKLSDLFNIFNWSMTYRTDSDVPVPYGRTLALQEAIYAHSSLENILQLVPHWEEKRRDVLAAILISNCGVSYRMEYLNEFKKYLDIDVHGRCSDKAELIHSCPGHYKADCKILNEYLFYLVFENSLCHEYITEKVFHQAYAKGAIPVILGPPLEDCEKLLPPNSFLHIDNFSSPEALAKELIALSKSEENLISYHVWRNDFVVSNEHGYFGSKSYHLCRLCEAMNYNDESVSVYDETRIKSFFDPSMTCGKNIELK